MTASVDGIITNFDLRPGDYVTAGHPVTAPVNTDSLGIDACFQETRLPRIHPGDRVEIRLMGKPQHLTGHVESISGGVADRSRQQKGHLLADVNPPFERVRPTQRIPVRIVCDGAPADIRIITGRTATVTMMGSGP